MKEEGGEGGEEEIVEEEGETEEEMVPLLNEGEPAVFTIIIIIINILSYL